MKTPNTKPLFPLTAEEVEIVRFALAKRQYQLDNLLTSWEKEGVDESNKEFEYYRDQYNKEQPILTRIKQWQNEQANNNHN